MIASLTAWFQDLRQQKITVGFWTVFLVLILFLFWHRVLRDVVKAASEV